MDLDADLYRAVKVEAARADLSVRELISEALDHWLVAREDEEDRRSAQEALVEYEHEGGEVAADYFRHLAAEARAAYGAGAGSVPSEE